MNGKLTKTFLYQTEHFLVVELDGEGQVVARFVYGARATVPEYLIKEGVAYRILADHLGSPRFVVEAVSGEVVQQMEYDAFGQVLLDTNLGFQPFGYAGGLYDRDSGLVRFGMRDYDPKTGRWMSQDPIGVAGGLNLYVYVGNDPVNFVDPHGTIKVGERRGCWTLAHVVRVDRVYGLLLLSSELRR